MNVPLPARGHLAALALCGALVACASVVIPALNEAARIASVVHLARDGAVAQQQVVAGETPGT